MTNRLRFVLIPLAGLLLAPDVGAIFKRPPEKESRRAVGDLSGLPATLHPLFTPDADFRPVPLPGPNDWLTLHNEAGQTFDQYRESDANQPSATRDVIYLFPVGEFPEDTTQDLELVRTYAAIFYQMKVRLLPGYLLNGLEFSPRQNPRTGGRQLLAPDIMEYLKTKLPPDAYCLLGVTMEDLYPEKSWNYVFGQASLKERVGIFSLARYDPAFWGEDRGKDYRDIILQRACKVLVHEAAHMFGLQHCIHFECVVNGTNHMVETDANPQHLCVVCLRKIYHATGFDPVRRYRELAAFYRERKWYDELDFANRQLSRLAPSRK